MKTKRIHNTDLKPGDTLVFANKGYRVTEIKPYEGILSNVIWGIAAVEGHGDFMSLAAGHTIEVAA